MRGKRGALCQEDGDGYGKVFKDGMPNDLSLGATSKCGKFHGQGSLVHYSPQGCERVGHNLMTKTVTTKGLSG